MNIKEKVLKNALTTLGKTKPGRKIANAIETNLWASIAAARPNTYSLWSPDEGGDSSADYLSWPSVTNKDYFARHLGPRDSNFPNNEPLDGEAFGQVTKLFSRNEVFKPGRSNVLFLFFAQWFTDGLFRSNTVNPRKTDCGHNVDLVQIYGASEEITKMLRSGSDGKMAVIIGIDGLEYPDKLFEKDREGNFQVKEKYSGLDFLQPRTDNAELAEEWIQGLVMSREKECDPIMYENLLATGLDRGNATIGNIAMNTLFLREHNLICDKLRLAEGKEWSDERLFQTARIINIVVLIRLTIEEYINHVAGGEQAMFDPTFAEKKNWYRDPWIAAEFNLLYRWHGLVPDLFDIEDGVHFSDHYGLLLRKGLDEVLTSAVKQQAGAVQIGNTPSFLMRAEQLMIEKGRNWKLRYFNDYSQYFTNRRLNSFDELTDDELIKNELTRLYGHISNVEFTVGLYAEKPFANSILGKLQAHMVSYDAYTQLYTNPLLSNKHYTEKHFTATGMKHIADTKGLSEFVSRNTGLKHQRVGFNYDGA